MLFLQSVMGVGEDRLSPGFKNLECINSNITQKEKESISYVIKW